MNFGEMKTTVYARIPKERREEVSVFEFGEAIDAAQRLLAAVLPARSIPDLIVTSFIDRRNDIGAEGIIPLPEDYLRIESVQFAQARDDDDLPLREPARIVTPGEFEELIALGTEEQIASVFDGTLHLHPNPTGAVTDMPAAIKFMYRKVPRPYMTTAGIIQAGARMHLHQDYDSRHTFWLKDYGGSANQQFSYWNLTRENVPGGYAFIGAPYMTAMMKGPLYVCRIVMAFEENFGTELSPDMRAAIRVSSDDAIPFEDESPGVGFLFPYCYVTERQVFGYSGNAVEAEDWEFPEMNKAWHHLVCDYAVSRIEIRWNPQGAGAREDRVLRALSAAGANLKYAQEQG